MNATELSWKTSDGLNIYGKKWESNLPTKAVICMMHGMGEHINRYDHIAEMFATNGYAVIGCDHRGHGKSDGKRGHFSDFDTFLNDVDALLKVGAKKAGVVANGVLSRVREKLGFENKEYEQVPAGINDEKNNTKHPKPENKLTDDFINDITA